ncbi:glycerophosphodiester phosphodiesterase [Sphaerotilus mobilis]|uniref:Glycerophosphoryl diester phosphodiesterase n=1 Tax=Sphaerotilus mobilis TaxID=47994 RepID=A0A4Q7LDF7_9BURK|nr:glycerophosphodiester phosphodiesterase [Sphaerotilus mobilis]RZS52022.1 glycerophosphoryl diester phosphodiesterase [Sphaerotilus mobilis]
MTAPRLSPWPYPRWIAHRGAGKRAPENTLAAFRHGAALGWTSYECDVKLSADGELFLLHDDTLQRTSNGHGVAGLQDWPALSRLDAGSWLGSAWAGEPLPRLEAIARHCLAHGHTLNIEIKPTTGTDAPTGRAVARAAHELWRDAVEAGRSPWPLLSSFQPDALAAARVAAPELPRALLLASLKADSWQRADELDCVAVVLDHRLIDGPELIAQRQANGLRVLVYTVNDPARARQLFDWGLDGVISDAVDGIREAVGPLAEIKG